MIAKTGVGRKPGGDGLFQSKMEIQRQLKYKTFIFFLGVPSHHFVFLFYITRINRDWCGKNQVKV